MPLIPSNTLSFVLIGLCTGVLSGMFGVGGGIVLVPILVLAMGFPQLTANGISLVALLLPVGALSAYAYFQSGNIQGMHVKFGLLIAAGLFVGGWFGAKLAMNLPTAILQRGFAILLVLGAVKLWMNAAGK